MRQKIAVITGATACGKTALSIEVAKRIDAQVVSADSVQVYDQLDIGSAKPTLAEMQGVAHYMIGNVPPDAPISAAQYQSMAADCIAQITAAGKRPLVVGGTGLYINALTTPMDFTQAGADEQCRATLKALSPGERHEKLCQIDPATAQRLHPNDEKRVIRALEVFYTTGVTMSEYNAQNALKAPLYDSVILALQTDRELLYERIERRVDEMLKHGLVEEVKALRDKGYDRSLQSMQGLGYKEIWSFLDGECTLDEAVETIKRDTRRFAKRQLTWFRRDERIIWLDSALGLEKLAQIASNKIMEFYDL